MSLKYKFIRFPTAFFFLTFYSGVFSLSFFILLLWLWFLWLHLTTILMGMYCNIWICQMNTKYFEQSTVLLKSYTRQHVSMLECVKLIWLNKTIRGNLRDIIPPPTKNKNVCRKFKAECPCLLINTGYEHGTIWALSFIYFFSIIAGHVHSFMLLAYSPTDGVLLQVDAWFITGPLQN